MEGVIDGGNIQGNETIEYSLRFWIDSSVEDEALISGKTLSYKIEVDASQVISAPMMRKRDSDDRSTEMFYNYKDQIANIVFEDEINVPSTISDDMKWDVSAEAGTGQVMAYIEETEESTSENPLYKLHIQGNNGITANTDSSYLFGGFSKLTAIEKMEYLDTSNVTNMEGMFYSCGSLTSLDVSNFDTSNVISMSTMFCGCESLTSLDVSRFNTSNVTSISNMFSGCCSLTNLDVSNFDTSNVTRMENMFCGCSSLTNLDLSNFDISNVIQVKYMFEHCENLTSLIFGERVIFSKVNDYGGYDLMFYDSNPTVYVKTQEQSNWLKGKFPSLNVVIG